MDENDRFLVVVLDDHRARLFISQLGSIVEIADLVEEGPSLHSKGGWAQMRFQRHHDAHVLWHAGAVAHATGLALDRFAASRFLVAGTPDVLADYRGQLSPPVAERLAGEFKVMATASPSEIAAVALPVQREVEAQQELAMVRLLEEQPAGGKAAVGLNQTLRSLNEYRVRTLVLLDDYRAPGATCADDGQLTDGTEGLCPYCGEGIIPVDDVVDLALERAHRQGAAIELVRSEEARAQLSQKAPIAALLRY